MLVCRGSAWSCMLPSHTIRHAHFVALRHFRNRIRIPKVMEVKLTPKEEELCTLLDGCTKEMKVTEGLETSCRIAGGWVRDKLLGMRSNDIDIALSDMMGVPFAERFVKYCSQQKGIPVRNVTKISSNPQQSKHLETAKTTVLDYELDFVNLRSEHYAKDSRIPTEVAFGTPLEDALRRDITINALFYNVHSRSVEDHTGRGLDDLRKGIVRTPLAPRETFLDDPLRVLRCIRFASRYGFQLEQSLQEAAADSEIQDAIVSKISRERVGEEIDKMMKGRDPPRAISYIHDLSLYSTIFHVPDAIASTFSAPPQDPSTAVAAVSIFRFFLVTDEHVSSREPVILPPLHPLLIDAYVAEPWLKSRMYLACALTPYRGTTCASTKGKVIPALSAVLREGLRLGTQNRYLDGIPLLFAASEMISKAITDFEAQPNSWSRVKIGSLLKDKTVHWPPHDHRWYSSVLFSLVQDLVPLWDAGQSAIEVEAATKRIDLYNAFVDRVHAFRLPEYVDAKPLLSGSEVIHVLTGAEPGPWMTEVLDRITKWELENPGGTREQCEEWLRAEYAAGRINTGGKRSGRNDAADATSKKVKVK